MSAAPPAQTQPNISLGSIAAKVRVFSPVGDGVLIDVECSLAGSSVRVGMSNISLLVELGYCGWIVSYKHVALPGLSKLNSYDNRKLVVAQSGERFGVPPSGQ